MTEQLVINPTPGPDRITTRRIMHALLWLLDHWVLVFLVGFGIFLFLPFLAPAFMRIGWMGPAQFIYAIYSTQCHQMAQRSFFLFGPQPMYNVSQLPIKMTGDQAGNLLALRAFIGSADLGWKVAWSDRMVYMYGGMWLAAAVFGFLRYRRNVHPLRLWYLGPLFLPMVVDGTTHFLSDMTGGVAGGFRYENAWIAHLTGNILPSWFYTGDALGSFNSWMRLITGALVGIAFVWFAFPYLERYIRGVSAELRWKLLRAAAAS